VTALQAPLSEDAVVDAALAILKSDGLEAVTMRRVAAALDTGAASLYVYVSGRDGLLQAMLDRVTATIELEAPDPSRWRAQLHSLLQRMRLTMVAHPGIAAVALADPPTTEAVLQVTENMMGILLAGGLDAQDAAWTCDILVLLVTGVASEDVVRRSRGPSDDNDGSEQIEELYGSRRRGRQSSPTVTAAPIRATPAPLGAPSPWRSRRRSRC
jgi:AcrR family transcriptional regulator